MPWTAELHPELPIVEVRYAGWVSPEELEASVRRGDELAQAAMTGKVLIDCSRIEGGHSAFDLHKMAVDLSVHPRRHALREAVLIAGDQDNSNPLYWEDACVMRGLQVRLFRDRAQALDWLMQ